MVLEQRIDGIAKNIEELDKTLEDLQKGMEDDTLEFAKRMDASWSKLRQALHNVSSGNLSTEAQSDNAKRY